MIFVIDLWYAAFEGKDWNNSVWTDVHLGVLIRIMLIDLIDFIS